MHKPLAFAAALAFTAAPLAAHATIIVNLSAAPIAPNAGPLTAANSGGIYRYNPITLSLAAGTYTFGLAGIAGGGLFDAYAVAIPAGGNFTAQFWGFSVNGGASTLEPNTPGRYATPSLALAAYQALGPLTVTLSTMSNVSFFIEDAAGNYFADNAGGVSVAINQVTPIAEPATLVVLGSAFAGLAALRRRRRKPPPPGP